MIGAFAEMCPREAIVDRRTVLAANPWGRRPNQDHFRRGPPGSHLFIGCVDQNIRRGRPADL